MKAASRFTRALALPLLACGVWTAGWAGNIYTCVDGQGRKHTADRPIPECIDREQHVLNPSGSLRQKISPSLTAAERAQKEARDKQEQEVRNLALEERRRDKALTARFPNRAALDRGRADAIAQATAASDAASARIKELAKQRKKLDEEMEFYRKDPSKAPQNLQRQVEEHKQNVASQEGLIQNQEAEVKRINTRFDADLVRLQQLWPAGQ